MKNFPILLAFLWTAICYAKAGPCGASQVNCTDIVPYLRNPTSPAPILNVHERADNSVTSKSWRPVVAVLCSALGLSLLLVLLSKAWRFHKQVSSYRHKHIDEVEDLDEGSGSLRSRVPPGYSGFKVTVPSHLGADADDTEDGFIEDEYVKDSDMVEVEHEDDSD